MIKGIVLRKTKHRQILSIEPRALSEYLRDLPTDDKGRNLFEVTENPDKSQHEKISHFLTPLGDRFTRKINGPTHTKPDGPEHFKGLNNH